MYNVHCTVKDKSSPYIYIFLGYNKKVVCNIYLTLRFGLINADDT